MTQQEQQRILDAYSTRAQHDEEKSRFFGLESVAHNARIQERLRETRRLLRTVNIHTLAGRDILDVGCGDGNMLRRFVEWGAAPSQLKGIELRPDAVARAQEKSPHIDVHVGSATSLPWPDESFDIVCQHTVFTSVLDTTMKREIANEMQRVLRPGGVILWYDFAFDNPNNADVKGVKAGEIKQLFAGMTIHLKRLTLAPPIARRIPDAGVPVLYPLLALFPFVRTHLLGIFVKSP